MEFLPFRPFLHGKRRIPPVLNSTHSRKHSEGSQVLISKLLAVDEENSEISCDQRIQFYLMSLEQEINELSTTMPSIRNRAASTSSGDFGVSSSDRNNEKIRAELEVIRKYKEKTKEHERRSKKLKFLDQPDPVLVKNNKQNELLNDIQGRLSNRKYPCIEDLYFQISKKHKIYRNYKNRINDLQGKKTVPESLFVRECLTEKCSPLPVLSHVRDSTLVLNRYNLSDAIAIGVGSAIPNLGFLKTIHLDQCGLSDTGGAAILKGITAQGHVTSFYYTRNTIGPKFTREVKNFALKTLIVEVNFKGCRSASGNTSALLENLYAARLIEKMNLSEIRLSNISMVKVSKFLKRKKLLELDLSWNSITTEASIQFFRKLARNKYLKSVDYSWNKLASPGNEVALAVGEVIATHGNLMHLNLSYTMMNDSDTTHLVNPMQTSRSLCSLHLTGNSISQRVIDTFKDCLNVTENPWILSNPGENPRNPIRGSDVNHYRKNGSVRVSNINLKNHIGKSVISHPDNIVNTTAPTKERDLYFSKEPKELIVSRAVDLDSNKNWVFSGHCWICEKWYRWTVNLNTESITEIGGVSMFKNRQGKAGKVILKSSFNDWEELPLVQLNKTEFSLNLLLPPGSHKMWFILDDSIVFTTPRLPLVKWKGIYINEVHVPIRPAPFSLSPGFTVFNKEQSVFKEFTEDNDEIVKRMYQSDKLHYKISRIIRNVNHFAEIVDILYKNFLPIKDIFIVLASSSTYPTVRYGDFSKFCENCTILDDKLSCEQLQEAFSAFKHEANSLGSTEQGLNRADFFEMIVRASVVKEKNLSPPEAVQATLRHCVFKHAKQSYSARFRKEKLFCTKVDRIIEYNMPSLSRVFTILKERKGRYLSIHGLKTLLNNCGFTMKTEDLISLFASSKMSVVDELNFSGAYNKMLMVEFLEFIARLADLTYKGEYPLDLKLEQLLILLCNRYHLSYKDPDEPEEEDLLSDTSDE